MKGVIILDNPVLQEILNRLRDKETHTADFRKGVREAGYLMTYEIIGRECTREEVNIEACFEKAKGYRIKEPILQVIIMRAGAPLTEGGALLLDEIKAKRAIGVVDARRVEKEGSKDIDIEVGSFKVPLFDKDTILIVYDPMIATASTQLVILKKLKERGQCKKIIICSILGSQVGIEKLRKEFPEINIYTLAVDSGANKGLNDKSYIVPGLGDAGDRSFGANYLV